MRSKKRLSLVLLVACAALAAGSVSSSNPSSSNPVSRVLGLQSADAASIVDGVVYGCTNQQALNYVPEASQDDGSCFWDWMNATWGCTDPTANNFDPAADANDGSCVYGDLPGCTDSSASNYNPYAGVNDGSCTYAISDPTTLSDPIESSYGCTDPSASNYDSGASEDDGSCEYDASAITPMACFVTSAVLNGGMTTGISGGSITGVLSASGSVACAAGSGNNYPVIVLVQLHMIRLEGSAPGYFTPRDVDAASGSSHSYARNPWYLCEYTTVELSYQVAVSGYGVAANGSVAYALESRSNETTFAPGGSDGNNGCYVSRSNPTLA